MHFKWRVKIESQFWKTIYAMLGNSKCQILESGLDQEKAELRERIGTLESDCLCSKPAPFTACIASST